MKYRLKKDLPFAKAGDKIFQDEINLKYYVNNNMGLFYVGSDINQLLSEGWIEEVKPREFYIEIRKSDGVATDVYELIDASHNSANMIERYDYIKVREVVE